MDLKKLFGRNEEKSKNGVRVDMGDGAWLVVASAKSPKYTESVERHMRPYRHLSNDQISPEIHHRVICEAFADSLLLDWGGIKVGDQERPYSRENAKQLMLDFPDFKDFVWKFATDHALFHDDAPNA